MDSRLDYNIKNVFFNSTATNNRWRLYATPKLCNNFDSASVTRPRDTNSPIGY